MTILAKGQLQHHFWGNYAASIGLMFHNAELAAKAHEVAFPRWTIAKEHPEVLRFFGRDPELEAELENLYAHGADPKKVTSLAHSIDYGEAFTVEVDLTPAPTETQLEMF